MTKQLEIESIGVVTTPDDDADLSYLTEDYAGEPDAAEYMRQDAERLAGYGVSWSCVGVRVVARVRVAGVSQKISSGGLWGVEDDSGGEYIDEVAGEQLDELREMLGALGFAAEDIAAAIADDADAARAQLRADRAAILFAARQIDYAALEPAALAGPGRLDGARDRELTAACEILCGEGAPDASAGDTDSGEHLARFGRFVMVTDSAGFVSVDTYADADAAQAVLDERDAEGADTLTTIFGR